MRPLQDIEQTPIDSLKLENAEVKNLDKALLDDAEKKDDKNGKMQPHIIRRNIEDYLEQKALERRLRDVFDSEDDYSLDY